MPLPQLPACFFTGLRRETGAVISRRAANIAAAISPLNLYAFPTFACFLGLGAYKRVQMIVPQAPMAGAFTQPEYEPPEAKYALPEHL